MILRKTLCALFASVFLLAICCSQSTSQIDAAEKNAQSWGPKIAFQKYWDFSKRGEFDRAREYTTRPPDRYLLCNGLTRIECDRELDESAKKRQSHAGDKNFRELLIEPLPQAEETIPKNIFENGWTSYEIESLKTYGDEARLTITFKRAESPVSQLDVLMVREDARWKLFVFLYPGDHEFYAAPE